MQDKHVSSNSSILTSACMWLLIALVFGNAFTYVHVAASPMITEDNWTFVDTFLREALEDRLGFGDFLVKRAGVDHGQPLNKLVMLLHYRWFDLDFSVEALIGVAFAVLGFLLLYRMTICDSVPAQRFASFRLIMAAIAAIYVSLNSTGLFTFSLVTLGYITHLMMFATFYAAWQVLRGGALWPFAMAMLAYGIAGDGSAILSGTALVLVSFFAGWRLGSTHRAWQLFAITVGSLLASRAVYWGFGEVRGATQAVFNVPMSEHFAGLLALAHEAWRWVVVPLASGLVHVSHLQRVFPGTWQEVQVLLGLAFFCLHIWFWVIFLRSQPRAARFLAACMMLSFYAYVAGIIYGRVFVRGTVFLDQPRYATFYQLHVMALLLMTAARQLDMPPASAATRALTALAASAMLAVQVPLSMQGWAAVPSITEYYRHAAVQYGEMARQPASLAPCELLRKLCAMPVADRVRTMELLRHYRLNMYSPRFRSAHPDLAEAAGPMPR